MKVLSTIDRWLNKAEGALLIVLLIAMVFLAFAQVVLRLAFSSGFVWGDIFLRHAVLWIGFLGGALAISNKGHINIDALTHFMAPKVRSAFSIFTNLFGAAICVLLSIASVNFVKDEISSGTYVFSQIPSWYVETIIPGGFSLFVFHFLVRAAASVEELTRKGSPE